MLFFNAPFFVPLALSYLVFSVGVLSWWQTHSAFSENFSLITL